MSYQHCPAQGLAAVAEYLRTPNGAEYLDDAVCGSLTVDAVDELLADYGVKPNRENRRAFGQLVDAAITEGF